MSGLRKHVHGLKSSEPVSLFAESLKVSCQRGRLARDINNLWRRQLSGETDGGLAQPFARRVHNQSVIFLTFRQALSETLFLVGAKKLRSLDLMGLCVKTRIIDGDPIGIYSSEMGGTGGDRKAECADPAVEF